MPDTPVICRDRSKALTNYYDYPATGRGSTNGYSTYQLNAEELSLMNEAEILFDKKDYEAARNKYKLLAKRRPDFPVVLTYIGQTYEKNDQYSDAIIYEERATAINYYDYLAHYFLADNYFMPGNYKRAADEIVLASILNRNNTNIQKAMQRILPKAGYKAKTWCFEPQVILYRKGDTHIALKTAGNWMGYAMAKAAWKYEPGYRQANGDAAEGSYKLTEDKECLLSFAYTLTNDTTREWEQQPELATLNTTIGKNNSQHTFFTKSYCLNFRQLFTSSPAKSWQTFAVMCWKQE